MKKYIFRGGRGFDPYPVATVNVKPWSWRWSVQVKLGDSEQVSSPNSCLCILLAFEFIGQVHQVLKLLEICFLAEATVSGRHAASCTICCITRPLIPTEGQNIWVLPHELYSVSV